MITLLYLGEDDLYNVSFIENFDNDQNSYQYDNQPLSTIIDKAPNTSFLNSEKSYIDPFTGSLKFSSKQEENLKVIEESNIESISFDSNFSSEFITSDTGIKNVLSGSSNNSWNITVKSPSIINESIFFQDKYRAYRSSSSSSTGIDVAVKVVLRNAVSASRIRVSPNIGYGLYVDQLVLETTESNTNNSTSSENNFIKTLTTPIYSDKNIDIDFSEKNIKSFIIFFKQKKYKRTRIAPQQSEVNAKIVNYLAKNIRLERKKNHDILQDYVIDFFLKDFSRNFVLKNKEIHSYNYSKYYPTSLQSREVQILKINNKSDTPSDVDGFNRLKNADMISNMVFALVGYSLGAKIRSLNPGVYIESSLRSTVKDIESYYSGGIIPVGDSNNTEPNAHFVNEITYPFTKNEALSMMNKSEDLNLYEYMLSIKNIALISTSDLVPTAPQKRSFYVSKRIPLESRPMSVKCIASVNTNAISASTSSAVGPTSIELSVSIKDSPVSELDWKPILPFDLTEVSSELIIFDSSTKTAFFRFGPLAESVSIYKDNVLIPSTEFQVSGTSVKINELSAGSTYVAKYTPNNIESSKEIQLFSGSLASPVLTSASTMGQSGEYFSQLNYDMSIQLSNNPYIDRSKFLNAQYNIYTGTTTSSSTNFGNFDYSNYSPVKVAFEDGTFAINATNYLLNDSQVSSFENSVNDFYFIHYDKTLIFNKNPNKPFRVIYNYVQDAFRYRVIFRSLNTSSENYSLDKIIFKFSCEKENVIENKFIRYDNIFKPRLA
jgi:hypothetical protein